MKRILLTIQIILLAFVLLMVGCVPVETEPVETEPVETEPPEIELTLENYSKYLVINTKTSDYHYLSDDICIGKAYFYTYCSTPGKFKNVEIRLRLTPKQTNCRIVTSSSDFKNEVYTSFKLPTDGDYTSNEYELYKLLLINKDNIPGIYCYVESISGTFIPD